jgi:glucan phosphoethanolaminetransferase (alkaline phosphatase superfamily)
MPSWSRSFLVYIAVPLSICGGLILLFFSGNSILQDFVAPSFNREFGALENLQNVLLIGMFVISARAAFRKFSRVDRTAFVIIAVMALFVFLEEIDYGLHLWEILTGTPTENQAQVRNIHNMGENNKLIKLGVDLGLVLLFLVMPLVAIRMRNPYLRYLSPSCWAIATLVIMVVLSKLAVYLNHSGFNTSGAIRSNISEFRELIIYYLSLVYLAGVARRPSPFGEKHFDDDARFT